MCGIVGFIGDQQAAPILLDGLAHLEYRGYDSAGVAVISAGHTLQVRKALISFMILFIASAYSILYLLSSSTKTRKLSPRSTLPS